MHNYLVHLIPDMRQAAKLLLIGFITNFRFFVFGFITI